MSKRPELLPFQAEGVRRISYFGGRVLLADDMGLGKTFQALEWIRRHDEFPAIVVCPAFLKINWQRECWDKIRVRATVLNGRSVPRANSIAGKRILSNKILIVNYDILQPWMRLLKQFPATTLVVDECDRIKNGKKTKRGRCVQRLDRQTDYLIGISGTPVTSRPIELFPILHMLRPRVFASKVEFGHQFCKPKVEYGSIKFDGCNEPKVLNKLLKRYCMIRRRKKDVLKDLPDKTRSIVPLEIPAAGWKEYSAALNNTMDYIRDNQGPDAVKKARRAKALVKLGLLKKIAVKWKMALVYEWVDSFLESGEKLVLFCVHRSIAEGLKDRYGPSAVLVNGKVTGNKRQAAVDAFQNNPKIKLLVGNIAAAGVGLTLTSSCNVAFCELGWTPPEHLQAEDRVHRIGQKMKCFIYYLIAMGTIEEVICKILQRKATDIEAIMDGNDSDGVELALVDMIQEELLRMKDSKHSKLF